MVVDGRDVADRTMGTIDGPRDLLLSFYPDAIIAQIDEVAPDAAPMTAIVNHGAWIAACECAAEGLPSPGCIVFLDTPLGWCVRCGNAAAGGRWRPVLLPTDDERELIESVLRCRPLIGDRNWAAPETVADLVAQNREHGDPVPREGV